MLSINIVSLLFLLLIVLVIITIIITRILVYKNKDNTDFRPLLIDSFF